MDSVNAEESALKLAHEAGQASRADLELTNACPFKFGSALWHAWHGGWLLEENGRLRESIAHVEASLHSRPVTLTVRRQRAGGCRTMWGIWNPRSGKWLFGGDGALVKPSPLPLAAWLHQYPSYREAAAARVAKFPDDPTQPPTEFWSPESESEAKGLEAHE